MRLSAIMKTSDPTRTEDRAPTRRGPPRDMRVLLPLSHTVAHPQLHDSQLPTFNSQNHGLLGLDTPPIRCVQASLQPAPLRRAQQRTRPLPCLLCGVEGEAVRSKFCETLNGIKYFKSLAQYLSPNC